MNLIMRMTSLAALATPSRRHPISMRAGDRQRLQALLDSVDASAAPRIHITHGGAPDISGKALVVLDSSFNPPTRAHMYMLSSVVRRFGPASSVLLLAKQNADKPLVGASLLQRLEMMEQLAADESEHSMVCGVTAHPLFVDKAAALQTLCDGRPDTRVILIVGYDTWTRIVEPKYYKDSEGGVDAALRRIFDAVEVVVASRDPSSASNLEQGATADDQEAFVRRLPDDITQQRLHFLRTESEMAQTSSSAVRKAAAAGQGDAMRAMLPESLHAYVEQEGLYRDQ